MAKRQAHCLDCGYDLRGLETARCPECGRDFDPRNPTTFGTRADNVDHRYVRVAAALLATTLVATGVLGLAALLGQTNATWTIWPMSISLLALVAAFVVAFLADWRSKSTPRRSPRRRQLNLAILFCVLAILVVIVAGLLLPPLTSGGR